jgi:spore coat polysaccharide biosynthesis protein SpsF|tara:strand:- start:28164 stop:28928 length:765 start_codon:yes stop_codon:yes gene_type:complete
MDTLAILQARCSSTRLPNKVIKPLADKEMILHQIDRIKQCKNIDALVVATSTDPSDNALAELCNRNSIECFRGSLNNVLDRFYQAWSKHRSINIVRLTGDCPLTDPEVTDRVISEHIRFEADYTSNVLPPTYPDGLDVEVFNSKSLETAWKNAKLPSELEHVTPYIINHPELFSKHNVTQSVDLSHLRWTVDNPEDFIFVEIIYHNFFNKEKNFLQKDIVEYIESHPEIKNINKLFTRNSGYNDSLKKDNIFIK